MPPLPHPTRRLVFRLAVILISGAIWLAIWQLSQALLAFTLLKNGITLVYVPAGVRLVILLVTGIWGAIGIALAFPFALVQMFPGLSWQEIATYSAIAGFVPYLAILCVCRLARISRDLSRLRPIHLPIMAAAVSLSAGLAFTVVLIHFGRFARQDFLPDAMAISVGHFLGCFTVVMVARVALAMWRRRP